MFTSLNHVKFRTNSIFSFRGVWEYKKRVTRSFFCNILLHGICSYQLGR